MKPKKISIWEWADKILQILNKAACGHKKPDLDCPECQKAFYKYLEFSEKHEIDDKLGIDAPFSK